MSESIGNLVYRYLLLHHVTTHITQTLQLSNNSEQNLPLATRCVTVTESAQFRVLTRLNPSIPNCDDP